MENKLNQRALVVGMARSGVSAAILLRELGYIVRLSDSKNQEQLQEALSELSPLDNIEYRLGEPAQGLLDDVDLVVISPGVPIDHPVVTAAQEKGIELIGELELAARHGRGRLFAITGTNGKTTTTALVGEIFKNAGKMTYVVGNIGLPYTSVVAKTRPGDMTVCEVSSFQLETVSQYHPEISAILNFSPDHLNRHKTMDNYLLHKARIFINQVGDDCVVLNYDDEAVKGLAAQVKCKVIWFSRTQVPPGGGSYIRNGEFVYGDVQNPRVICPVNELVIPGPHNVENALAASAIAMRAGIPAPVIRHTLRTFKGVEHRMEPVRTLDSVAYINDSKGTNVDSTLKAIEAMTKPTVLIAGGSSKQVDMLPLARAIQAGNIDRVVLVGVTASEISHALDAVGFDRYTHAGVDFEKAVTLARDQAKPGGVVMLSPACASFDMFDDYEHRGREFKRIVLAFISGG